MPQLPGITLLQFLRQRRRQNNQQLGDDEVRRLIARLALQLQAVHQSGIVHCDLNLENVIVSQDLSHVWLIDFGGATNFLDNHQINEMTGTPGFVAPERVQDPLTPPTSKADVFSLGILFFQVLTGQHPYLDAVRDKRRLELSDSLRLDLDRAEEILAAHAVSRELRELVGGMLKPDPQTRTSLDKVLVMVK
ncbi:Serine/threonine protein kinase [Phytophthora megakarya]|uniref:Serine/threonine protein kinase n=1 Tax=Phytophthora megakarya TaxID=4795 RepID=A0A225WJJ7_9STRA|nr:Serine/threonine protein kinase [Phytophthora megakarya]